MKLHDAKTRERFARVRAGEQCKAPTRQERIMRDLLVSFGFKFQHVVVIPGTGTKNDTRQIGGIKPTPAAEYILDFYHPQARLIVEVDGKHHHGKNKGRDRRRTNLLITVRPDLFARVLRFDNDRVDDRTEWPAIIDEVWEAMNQ